MNGDWGLGPGLYYVSPFYIYFLAVILKLSGSFTAVRIGQTLLGTVAIAWMYLTTREWFGERAARYTLALAAFTGLFTFYEVLLLQTAIDVFFTASALLCLTYALRAGTPRAERLWTLAAGLAFGLQATNRPNIALAAAGLIVVAAALRRWQMAALLAGGLALGLAPFAVRNVIVAHQFSVLSSHGGLNFYMGNGPGATGFYHQIPGITPSIKGQALDARLVASRALGRTVDDRGASDYFMDQALGWMAAHPAEWAWLTIRKFALVFHAQHVPLPYSYPFYQYDWPTFLRFLIVGPWLLVPLGLVGLWWAAPSGTARRAYLLWVAFVPLYAGAVALFFISERYRLPLLVPLAIGAGAACDALVTRARAARWREFAAPAAATALLLVLVNTNGKAVDGRWEEGLRLAAQYVLQGRFDEADRWVDRLEQDPKHRGNAHASIGEQYLLNGEPARALAHLEQAAALKPNDADTEYRLGMALAGAGRPADAVPHLAYGMEHGAKAPLRGYHLAAALRDAGQPDAAAAVIPQIQIGDDRGAGDWLLVGRLAMEVRAPAAAEPYFRQAVALAPESADAHLQYGVNLVVLGRFADARSVLGDAVRLDPRNASAYAYLALADLQLGDTTSARTHVAAALRLDPAEPTARAVAAQLR
jgi:Flp pilus assembly protein TadD